MKRFCKNILPISLALILGLTSCGDKDIDPVDPVDSTEIQFGKVTTRSLTNPTDGEAFGVWATASNEWTSGYQSLLPEEEKVYYDAGKAQWTYDNKMYWAHDTHFYFLASYPYGKSTFEKLEQEDGEGQKYVIFYSDIVADGTSDSDIYAALTHVDTGNEDFDATDPVLLEFQHLLTKVNFKIEQDFDKSPDFDYYVTRVTITGIKDKGTHIVMPYGTTPYRVWNIDDSSTKVFEKEYSTPIRLRNPDASDKRVILTVFGEGLFLIPQEIEADVVRIRVDYYYDVDPGDDDIGDAKYVESFIPASVIWESNKSITYALAISDQNDIKFLAPTIESWGSPQTGGTILIK